MPSGSFSIFNMKPSQTTQTVLVFSSWTGNLILTGLAFALAFRSTAPLTPLTFLTIAFCILMGNALPIAVHWINYRWSKALLEAEEAEAELTLRSAVARIESVESRLQDIYEASSKGLLIARQVPERINEKSQRLESLLESLDGDSLAGLSENLSKHGQQLSENLASSRELEERLRRWIEETGQMNERNDEDRETLEKALQGLVKSWGEDVSARLEDEKEEAEEEPAEVDLEDYVEEDADTDTDTDADTDVDDDTPPVVKKQVVAKEPPQPQEAWEDLLAAGSADIQKTQDDKIVVIAKCMVGIRNRIHARGEGGGLSWEDGIPMELTGIGEYRLELKNVKKPVTLKLMLNDQQWAKGDNLTIHPGQVIRIQPKF